MSEFEDTSPSPADESGVPTTPDAEKTGAARKSRRWLKRLLLTIVGVVVLLGVAGTALYNFGGMSGSVNDPEMTQEYERLLSAGSIQPVSQRFVIGIPGCQCHSTDPVLTEQHRNRRIRECSGCHSR